MLKLCIKVALMLLLCSNIANAATNSSTNEINWDSLIFFGSIFAGFFAMIIHTTLDIFISPFKKEYTVEYFKEKKQKNIASNLSAKQDGNSIPNEMTPEEAIDIINKGFENWGHYDDDMDKNLLPDSRKKYMQAYKALKLVEKSNPTDPNVVAIFQGGVDSIRKARSRKFDGSKLLLGLSFAVFGLVCYIFYPDMSKIEGGLEAMSIPLSFLLISIYLYYAGSRTPYWLKENRSRKSGGSHIASKFLGGAFLAALATPDTTYIKYTDGTTEKRVSASKKLEALAEYVGLIVIMVCFISFFGFVNYLRNYIFYK